MAIIQIPHDMTEFQVMVQQLKNEGKTVDEDALLQQAIVDNAQNLLDVILDGHYYTVKPEKDKLVVLDVINQPAGEITPIGKSFKEDFEKDADGFLDYLDDRLHKIAGGR